MKKLLFFVLIFSIILLSGCIFKENTNNQEAKSTENKIPLITFQGDKDQLLTFEADEDKSFVFRDGKQIGEVNNILGKVPFGKILAQNENYCYFYFPSDGVGGYIIGRMVGSIYQIDFSNNKIIKIIAGSQEVAFTPNLKKLFYKDSENLRLMSLPEGTLIKDYFMPDDGFGQVAVFKFSPLEDKIAFVVVWGPQDDDNDEKSAIYALNLNSGEYKIIEEKQDKIFKLNGWKDNETVDYE